MRRAGPAGKLLAPGGGMHAEAAAEPRTVETEDEVRVLVVADDPAPALAWPPAGGKRFRVSLAPSPAAEGGRGGGPPAAAAPRLAASPFDVVVLDAAAAAGAAAEVARLGDAAGGAALLVRADDA